MVTAEERHSSEPLLFMFLSLLLLGIGLSVLYSASYDRALRLGLPGSYFFERQLMFALIGIGCAAAAALISPKVIRKLIPLLLLSSFAAMLLTRFTALGETRLGATRWLALGPLSFQPSELVKVAVIFYIAHYADRKQDRIREFWIAAVPVAVVFTGALLIIIQNDFSTTIIFTFLSFSVLLAAGMKLSHLGYFAVLAGIPGIMLMLTESYRLRRLIGFIFKDIDPSGINYQVHASIEAIAAGGLTGAGFGQGSYKLGRIPEVQTDFIFAAFAEEFGFLGVTLALGLFILLAFLGFRGASKQFGYSPFLYIAGFGCTFLIIWQVLVNVSVVSGIIPPTGIPLPFFSSGGTNLVINLTMIGFLLGVILRAPRTDESTSADSHPQSPAGYEL